MNLIYLSKFICIIGVIVTILISTVVAQTVTGEVKITGKKDFSGKSVRTSSNKKIRKKRKPRTKGGSGKKKHQHSKKRKSKKELSFPVQQNSTQEVRKIR